MRDPVLAPRAASTHNEAMVDTTGPAHAPSSTSFESDPVIDAYKEHVDRTLIRQQLVRTPDERARNMIASLKFALALREAGRAARS